MSAKKHYGAITTVQVTELLGIKQRRARDILAKMIGKRWIKKRGSFPKYSLGNGFGEKLKKLCCELLYSGLIRMGKEET